MSWLLHGMRHASAGRQRRRPPRQWRLCRGFILVLAFSVVSQAHVQDLLRRRPPHPHLSWLYRKVRQDSSTSGCRIPYESHIMHLAYKQGGATNNSSVPKSVHEPLFTSSPAPSPPVSTPEAEAFPEAPTPALLTDYPSRPRRSKARLLRDAVFPIYGREVHKFFSMGMIKFLIVFVLTITRDVKDTLIVTSCGAESIAFLKVYGVLPAAAAFTVAYSKMSNALSKDALYYALVAPFFLFYLLFDLVIYPRRHQLHPTATATSFQGLSYLLGLYNNWTFALYYIVSEIYSSVSIGLLFWQFANDVITVDEAKRFYPLFGQLSSVAPIIAGQCVARVADGGDFGGSLRILTGLTTLCGMGIMVLYHYCSRLVQKEASDGLLTSHMVKNLQQSRPRPQLSLQESASFLLGSQYLRYMAVLVLGFGLAINFTDILWKSMVKDYFPDKLAYQRFMGFYSSTVGATTFVVIFFGSNIVKHLGWRIGALATPVMMAALAVPFFAAIFLKGFGASSKRTALLAVGAGALMSVLSKATKYALFDPTTQMAYIPLDEESKSKGKAAIDVLGSRVGKSLGALLLQACVMVFGSALRASYVVGGMFYAVIFSWIFSANNLAGLFQELTERPRKYGAGSGLASGSTDSGGGKGGAGSDSSGASTDGSGSGPTPVAAAQEVPQEVPAEVPPSSSAPSAFLDGGLNPHIAPPPIEGREEGSEEGEEGEGGGEGEGRCGPLEGEGEAIAIPSTEFMQSVASQGAERDMSLPRSTDPSPPSFHSSGPGTAPSQDSSSFPAP